MVSELSCLVRCTYLRGSTPKEDIKLVRIVVTVRRVNVQFVVETKVEIDPSDVPADRY